MNSQKNIIHLSYKKYILTAIMKRIIINFLYHKSLLKQNYSNIKKTDPDIQRPDSIRAVPSGRFFPAAPEGQRSNRAPSFNGGHRAQTQSEAEVESTILSIIPVVEVWQVKAIRTIFPPTAFTSAAPAI